MNSIQHIDNCRPLKSAAALLLEAYEAPTIARTDLSSVIAGDTGSQADLDGGALPPRPARGKSAAAKRGR